MGLYLVQHGEAVPENIDPDRPLTDTGKAEVLRVAGFLKGKIDVDVIWHSTKLRARETAIILAESLSPRHGLTQKDGLSPNDPVDIIKEDICDGRHNHLMIVGHLPFLGKLTSLLLAGSYSGSHVIFRPGGVCYVEHTDKGNWAVAWCVVPELVA